MKLILVRHGEVVESRHDSHLTRKGRLQCKLLAKKLKKEKVDAIYSSSLRRAKQTAVIVGKERKQKVVFTSVLSEFPDEVVDVPRRKWKNSKYNLERIKELRKFLKDLNGKYEKGTVLLVGHAKTNRVVVSILNKINPYCLRFFLQKHCNITIVEYGERRPNSRTVIYGWKVQAWNRLDHLPKNLVTGRNREK